MPAEQSHARGGAPRKRQRREIGADLRQALLARGAARRDETQMTVPRLHELRARYGPHFGELKDAVFDLPHKEQLTLLEKLSKELSHTSFLVVRPRLWCSL